MTNSKNNKKKSKKHNSKNQFMRQKSYKNDTEDLVNLGQFLRDAFGKNLRVEREWCVYYDNNERLIGTGKNMLEGRLCRFKTPDLMLFNNITGKLICCVELDGKVHDTVAFGDTLDRNELYEKLGIPLIVLSKSTMEVSMYDDCHSKVEPYILRENLNA